MGMGMGIGWYGRTERNGTERDSWGRGMARGRRGKVEKRDGSAGEGWEMEEARV